METKLGHWTRSVFHHASESQILYILMRGKSSYRLKSSVDQKQGEKCAPSENDTVPYKRLPYLQLAFIMVAGFAVAAIGIRVLSRPIVEPIDPFSAYMDIFPGQHMSAVRARGFFCNSPYNFNPNPVENCTLAPASGMISNINLSVLYGVISRITFTMRGNSLKVGDLLLLTEARHFHMYPFLSNKQYAMGLTRIAASRSLFSQLGSVSFINIDQLQ